MLFSSEFDASTPIGGIVPGPNIIDDTYLEVDGRTLLRATYQRLSDQFPIGKLTGTIRTLAIASPQPVVAASPTYFVAPATSGGTAALQISTDGVTYAATPTPAFTASALLWAGNRFVGLSSAANQPIVTTGDAPNGTWTSTTGGPASVTGGNSMCRLCYAPNQGPTPGRILAVPPTSGTTLFTLDDGATAWVSRAIPGTAVRQGGCWTGARFLVVGASASAIEASPDATAGSWTTIALPENITAANANIASNGAGVVVISGCAVGLLVSYDHGATWAVVNITGVPPSDLSRVQYAGDRFFLPTAQGLAMSLDGKHWFLETTNVQAGIVAAAIAKKGTMITEVTASITAHTFAESLTEFAIPKVRAFSPSISGAPTPLPPFFIKVL